MSTILKWAGNKTAIMSELKKHLPAGPRLVEPFAGSCAVMMETDYPSYLVADINPDLINLYKKVAADCESFISRARVLFEIANREVAYYNIRQEFNYSTEITDFMKAVYFLYLNRHGYRGLCRYNKSGHFNIPYGNYKNPYFPEKEIRAFAEKAKRATFICASFDETLAMLQVGDPRTDITSMDDKELHDYLHSMNKKERRELAARLRLVKPKRRKDYKQRITDHQRQQLVYELKSRGFNGSEKEVDLLLRGGSIPSGAGLRIFYRNQRLQEDDKWRNLY
ncbi:TPA: Dam family site-specific DNA-(adenine-N6)-methyltransferase [Escherichia coli]|nr:Dam family site-specific DNA-(adenine-N6)-methyltransferase [Escherichia coli]HBA2647406.1 Dam family site-specific DNA-(adenine-N6)-methyltransferase [Escherichia coli]